MTHPDQSQFPGTEADTKVSVQNTTFSTPERFELGDKVTLLVHGHITMTGRETIAETEGERGVTKIHADVIEVQGSAS
jgi:hypothetical protein